MSGDEERIEVPRSPLRVPAGLVIEHVDPPARPQGAYRDEARRERRTLVMTLRDRSPFPWLLVVFAVSWNLLIAAFWLAPLGFRDAGLPTSLTLAMFTAIGLGLACVAIAVFTNRTVIRVAGDEIDVRRGPLPVWRQRAPVSTVRLTELRVRHRRRPSPEGVVETWDVLGETHDPDPVVIVSFLHDGDQAHAIARALQDHLGIAAKRAPR